MPSFAGGEIATVDQDVAGIGKGVRPQRDACTVLLQRVLLQAGVAKLDIAVVAMGYDVNGIEI